MIMVMRSLILSGGLALLATCGHDAVQPAAGQGQEGRSPSPSSAEQSQASAPRPADDDDAERRYDPGTVVPEGTVATVRQLLDRGETLAGYDRAKAEISDAPPAVRGRLQWLAAEAASTAGRHDEALRLNKALAQSRHPLAPWAALRAAAAFQQPAAGSESGMLLSPTGALELLAPLLSGDNSALLDEARPLQALALASAGRWDEAVPLLRELIEATPDHIGAATVAMPLAMHLADGDLEQKQQAHALYVRVATRAPKSLVGAEARAKAEALRAAMPARARRAAAYSIDDRFAEARAYEQSVLHQEAEAAYAALASDLRGDPEKRCLAQLLQGQAMLKRRARSEGAPFLRGVAERCADADIKARARYSAGRAYTQTDSITEALAMYDALVEGAPTHRLADDAHYRSARLHLGRGDSDAFIRSMGAVEESGDMHGEALFELAFYLYTQNRGSEALSAIDRAVAHGEENAEDLHGRAAYWRGRILAQLGRNTDAVAAFESLALDWPLAYYAQQSWRRLRELSPDAAERVRLRWRGPHDDERADEPSLDVPWREELETQAFGRIEELLRVGAMAKAQAEMSAAGFLGEGSDPDALWLSAALLSRAGALADASQLVRRRLGTFRRVAPHGRSRALWRLAYPNAFAPLIETTAREQQVPASFVRAVAREESAFEPKAVSWAHAYGLVQVILPTARRYGRGLDVAITPQTLRLPEVNLTVGTRYMAALRRRYETKPGLVPAAYNAGEGTLDRWLRAHPDAPLDEFVERIPYDETRRYTRRVLQTWGIYSWLEESRLPRWEQAVAAEAAD